MRVGFVRRRCWEVSDLKARWGVLNGFDGGVDLTIRRMVNVEGMYLRIAGNVETIPIC